MKAANQEKKVKVGDVLVYQIAHKKIVVLVLEVCECDETFSPSSLPFHGFVIFSSYLHRKTGSVSFGDRPFCYNSLGRNWWTKLGS